MESSNRHNDTMVGDWQVYRNCATFFAANVESTYAWPGASLRLQMEGGTVITAEICCGSGVGSDVLFAFCLFTLCSLGITRGIQIFGGCHTDGWHDTAP